MIVQCPEHGAQEVRDIARQWYGNLLIAVPFSELKRSDWHGQDTTLACGCFGDVNWYADDLHPRFSRDEAVMRERLKPVD